MSFFTCILARVALSRVQTYLSYHRVVSRSGQVRMGRRIASAYYLDTQTRYDRDPRGVLRQNHQITHDTNAASSSWIPDRTIVSTTSSVEHMDG